MTRIAIDAMGGDHAPDEIVKGALWAASDYDVAIELVGEPVQICLQVGVDHSSNIILIRGPHPSILIPDRIERFPSNHEVFESSIDRKVRIDLKMVFFDHALPNLVKIHSKPPFKHRVTLLRKNAKKLSIYILYYYYYKVIGSKV